MPEVPTGSVAPSTSETSASESSKKVPLFGARARVKELAAEVDRLRGEQERLGVLSVAELERRRDELRGEVEAFAAQLAEQVADASVHVDRATAAARAERDRLQAEVDNLTHEIVVTEETSLLQEVGVYEYRHPLSDALAYQAELKSLREDINLRREFFYATPEEVKAHLLDVAGEVLEYEDAPEALEYHQSVSLSQRLGTQPDVVLGG